MLRPTGIDSADATNRHVCLRKLAYSKKVAIKVARKIRRQTGHNVRHYRCPHCDLWHIGHQPGKPYA